MGSDCSDFLPLSHKSVNKKKKKKGELHVSSQRWLSGGVKRDRLIDINFIYPQDQGHTQPTWENQPGSVCRLLSS